MSRASLLFLLVLVAGACGRDQPEQDGGAGFAPDLGVNLNEMTETPSGLYMQDIVVGDGAEAEAGRHVEVHYTGWLPDGQQFDSSHDRGAPFGFELGAGVVVPGWDEGVAGMRVGGERKLVVPPDLGYGAQGRPPVIPPDATLVFDVELVAVH